MQWHLRWAFFLLLGPWLSWGAFPESWRSASCDRYLAARPRSSKSFLVLPEGSWIPRAPQGKIYLLHSRIRVGVSLYLYRLVDDRIFTDQNSPIVVAKLPKLPKGYRYEVQSLEKPPSGGEILKIKFLHPFPRAGREEEKLSPIEELYVYKEVSRTATLLFYAFRESANRAALLQEMTDVISGSVLLVEQLPVPPAYFAELLIETWRMEYSNEDIELIIISFMAFKGLIP